MGNLVKTRLKPMLALAILVAGARAEDSTGVRFDEFKARMAMEFGHVVRGEFRTAGTHSEPIRNLALNRNIVFLEQSGQFNEAWEFKAGLMGVLWWPYTPIAGPPGTRTMRVEPKLSILTARKIFDPAEADSYVEAGFFPYKYNRDAWNLGEYLYRSGTYPGSLWTNDGYQLMDHAAYDAYGVHARFSNFGGNLTHDFNFFTEAATDPIGDITPAYELSFNHPVFQFGFGAAYNRGLSYRPSQTRPKDDANSYIEVQADPAKGIAYYKGPFLGAPIAIQGDTTRPFAVLHNWTQRGLKLMGRAALDLGFLIPEASRSPEDLRLYAEVAVLGWENQPYFYEKRSERIPIMLGVNLPTFRILDLVAFQAEYYNAQFNDTYYYNIGSLPIWKVENYQTRDQESYKKSPWRWSLYGRKSFNRIVNIHAQVASDHLRLREATNAFTEYELTLYPRNWYYLVRMEIGI
ncbi:MAG: hypothetical protein JWP91_4163 [Fibrobacteres bacterium]|nr:hypothetical protein [Fibrobacterota bacterium]